MKLSHWFLLTVLYVAQFLPVAFFFMGLPAILRDGGMALEEIGALYGLGLIWVLKFLWAPLVDRIGFGRFGHYRIWLLVCQAGMVVMLLLLSRLDPVAAFPQLLLLSLAMTALAATQDIATDATACRLLPPHLRGAGNAIQTAGGVLGLVAGGGGMILVYGAFGWSGAVLIMAGLMGLTMVPILLYREPPVPPVPAEPTLPMGRRLLGVWGGKCMGAWALLLVLLNTGVSMVFPLLQTGLVDLGWPVERVGTTLNIMAPLLALGAVALAGGLLRRMSPLRLMLFALPVELVAVLMIRAGFAPQAAEWVLMTGILLIFAAHHAILTAVNTAIMAHTRPGHQGSDFTIQSSLFLGTGFVAGGIAMNLAGDMGYGKTFVIAALAMALAALRLLVSRRFPASPALPAAV